MHRDPARSNRQAMTILGLLAVAVLVSVFTILALSRHDSVPEASTHGEPGIGAKALTLRGGDANNTVVVRATATDEGTYTIDGSAPIPFAGIRSLTIDGVGGRDLCRIINPPGGLFAPPGGITCNGGNRTSTRRGILQVLGGSDDSSTYLPSPNRPGAGTLTHRLGHTVQVIRFSGLAPVTDTVASSSLVFTAPSTDDTVELVDGPSGELTIESAADDFESLSFANKTSVTIDATGAGDAGQLDVSQAATGLQALTFDAAEGITVDQASLPGVALSLGCAGTIDVSGPVTTGTAGIDLATGSTIIENGSGLLSTSGTLTTSSSGGALLRGANTIAAFSASNVTTGSVVLIDTAGTLVVSGVDQSGGGSVILDNDGSLDVTGVISADKVGPVTLTASASIEEAGGAVSTGGPLITSSGSGTTLDGTNAVSSVDATNATSGDISFVDTAEPLTVSGVSQTGGGAVTLSDTGTLDIAGPVSAASGGAIELVATESVGETGGVISTSGTLTIASSAGAILDAANSVGAFVAANTASGDLSLVDTSPLTVTSISQGGGDVSLSDTATLDIAGPVSAASGGAVDLVAGGPIAESGSGLVSTNGLLAASSGGGMALEGSNAIASLDATNTGSGDVSLADNFASLLVMAVSETGGGSVALSDTGSIGIAGTVSAGGGGAVDLVATGSIVESGSGVVSAGELTTSSDGGTELDTTNAVGELDATNAVSGDISLADLAPTLVIDGISQTGGSASVIDDGAITVTGTIATGAGDLNLTSTDPGALLSLAGGTLTGADVDLDADEISLSGGQVSVSGTATLAPMSAAAPIDLGAGPSGAFVLSSADLDAVTARQVVVGSSSSGLVTVGAPIEPSGSGRLVLESAGGFAATGSGSLTASDLSFLEAGSDSSTWSLNGSSVTDGAETSIPYQGVTTLAVTAGGGADTFDVIASATTGYSLDGGSASAGTLNYDAQGRTVSGTLVPPAGTIDSPTVDPVTFTRMAAVEVDNTAPTTTTTTTSTTMPVTTTTPTTATTPPSNSGGSTAVTTTTTPVGAYGPVNAPPPTRVGATTYGAPASATVRSGLPTTIDVSFAGATVELLIPAGALPSGTTVSVYPVTHATDLAKKIPAGQSYVISVAVTWQAPNGTSPPASPAATLTVEKPSIQGGDALYNIASSGTVTVGVTRTNGSITTRLSTGSTFVVAATPRLLSTDRPGTLESKGVELALRCRAGTSCHGTAQLTVIRRSKIGSKTASTQVTLARAPIAIAAGHTMTVLFRLTAAGNSVFDAQQSFANFPVEVVVLLKGAPRAVDKAVVRGSLR